MKSLLIPVLICLPLISASPLSTTTSSGTPIFVNIHPKLKSKGVSEKIAKKIGVKTSSSAVQVGEAGDPETEEWTFMGPNAKTEWKVSTVPEDSKQSLSQQIFFCNTPVRKEDIPWVFQGYANRADEELHYSGEDDAAFDKANQLCQDAPGFVPKVQPRVSAKPKEGGNTSEKHYLSVIKEGAEEQEQNEDMIEIADSQTDVEEGLRNGWIRLEDKYEDGPGCNDPAYELANKLCSKVKGFVPKYTHGRCARLVGSALRQVRAPLRRISDFRGGTDSSMPWHHNPNLLREEQIGW